MPSFEKDYDGHTGKRVTHVSPSLTLSSTSGSSLCVTRCERRIPGVGFNRVWRSIPPGGKLTMKMRECR